MTWQRMEKEKHEKLREKKGEKRAGEKEKHQPEEKPVFYSIHLYLSPIFCHLLSMAK